MSLGTTGQTMALCPLLPPLRRLLGWWDPPQGSCSEESQLFCSLPMRDVQSLYHLCAPSLNCLKFFFVCPMLMSPELDRALQVWPHQCRVEWQDPSFNLQAALFPVQPRTSWAFSAARAHLLLVFKPVFSRTPGPFLPSCFPAGWPPAHTGVWGCTSPGAGLGTFCWASWSSCWGPSGWQCNPLKCQSFISVQCHLPALEGPFCPITQIIYGDTGQGWTQHWLLECTTSHWLPKRLCATGHRPWDTTSPFLTHLPRHIQLRYQQLLHKDLRGDHV